MPVIAFIRISRTRPNQRREVARSDHVELQRRNNRLRRRADFRDVRWPLSQRAENMRGARRREGDDRISARNDSLLRSHRIRIGARGNVDRNHRDLDRIQKCDGVGVEPSDRRLKAGAQNRIEI